MGGLLQRGAAAAASIHIAFFTDGEDNPWPQRAVDRRWRIGPRERARWGARRRSEALHSLRVLGLGPERATFLGFPDQQLTSLVITGDPALPRALRELLDEHSPTHVIAPSVQDHHPDHSALGVAARTACARGRRNGVDRLLEYVVHDGRQRPVGHVSRIRLTHEETVSKRVAIACHASQLIFRRKELLAFANRIERYYSIDSIGVEEPSHPVRSIEIEGDRLVIRLVRKPCMRAFGRVAVQLLFPDSFGIRRILRISLPLRSGPAGLHFADGRAYPHAAEYRGGPYRGVLRVPIAPLPRLLPGYVKLESRFGFFDEAGWRTLPVLKVRGGRRALAAAAREVLAGEVPG